MPDLSQDKGPLQRRSTRTQEIPDDRRRPDAPAPMRPPGTPGLPSPYSYPAKRDVVLDVSDDALAPAAFIAALDALVDEIKSTGSGQRRYELEGGRYCEAAEGKYLYRFPFHDAEVFEDADSSLQVGGNRHDASIVAAGLGMLTIATKAHLGDHIPHAVLLIDSTALLKTLRNRLKAATTGEVVLRRGLANAVVRPNALLDKRDTPAIPAGHSEGLATLNGSQRRAHEWALREMVTFIWGPPGCGKTKTLGEIVRSAFEDGKRVLVCSNTNKAVDQLLLRTCEALTTQHPAMQRGKLVRLGTVADSALSTEYTDYVTPDGIMQRLGTSLLQQISQIESQISQNEVDSQAQQKILADFAELKNATKKLRREAERGNAYLDAWRTAIVEREKADARLARLNPELQRRRNSWLGLLQRKEQIIQRDINRAEGTKQWALDAIAKAKASYEATDKRYKPAKKSYETCLAQVEGQDWAVAESTRQGLAGYRARFVTDLHSARSRLSALKTSLVKEARILATTCTKAYLAHKEIGNFDLVVIDEASMVLLPMAWFVAGMSTARIVISGDFLQIPPIVPSQQQAILDVLSPDSFAATERNRPGHPELAMLDEQYRMDPAICNLVADSMYGRLLRTSPNRIAAPGMLPPEPFDGPLTIIDTSELWPFESRNGLGSRYNTLHALLARNLAWQFKEQGVIQHPKDFGVCTPYAAQAKLVGRLLEGAGLDEAQCGTVHRFQGDERRIVLLEFPESHGGTWGLGQFLQGESPEHHGSRLINVAVSRAQNHLIVLANLTYLDRFLPSNALLRRILYEMQEQGRVVSGQHVLELRPIQTDLSGLIGQVDLDETTTKTGVFTEDEFKKGFTRDIREAKETIAIFSGYITATRVQKLGPFLQHRISAGVQVRCVTRPPRDNGSMPENQGRDAVAMLDGIGAAVDFRANIHEKVCVIDGEIVWWGSLNVLSHLGHSDEMMTRTVNAGFAKQVAHFMARKPTSAARALQTIAVEENPRCANCKGRTVYKRERRRTFFECEAGCD